MSAPTARENSPLKDPVCAMDVTGDSPYRTDHAGKAYFFCSAHCLTRFQDHPQHYLDAAPAPPPPAPAAAAIYTCPMHPEIQQPGPGSCPKCGMALEALSVPAKEKNAELLAMSRRLRVCTALSLPVFVLAMIADMMPTWLPDWVRTFRSSCTEASHLDEGEARSSNPCPTCSPTGSSVSCLRFALPHRGRTRITSSSSDRTE